MKADITFDNKYLILSSPFIMELNIMRNALTREIPNAWMLKKTGQVINTDRSFINDYNMVPIGLWLEVIKICKKVNLALELSDKVKEYIAQYQLSYEEFLSYIDTVFDGAKTEKGQPFRPYDYQIKAAYTMIKYKKCCGEISTSGGKTLISFIIFKYLIDTQNINKILYIVPSVDLATQSAEKYDLYESYLKHHNHNWEIGILKGGLKKKEKEKVESCNILFGTFQSLCKKHQEFFQHFGAVITDECHHTGSSPSIKGVLEKCTNLKFSIGMTGTFPKENKYEYLTIQSYIGPLIYTLTANQLINEEKRGTPIYVVFEMLNYASQEEKETLFLLRSNKNPEDLQAGTKVLKEEQKFVNESYTRLKFICDMAIKTTKNSMILFGDIKGGYGKRIYEYIKDNSDKNVYYIDGTTPSNNREYYKQCLEDDVDGNTILVGSINTMGEGIDIKNLWTIFLVNTAKSERLVRQICGRGIRQYPGKDKVIIFDIVDDLRYSSYPDQKFKDNYLWKHYNERRKIYKEQHFPIYEQKYNFKNVGISFD